MTDTDEFVLADTPRLVQTPRRPTRWTRSAATWVATSAALVLVGVLATPGPVYPDLGEGIAWNVLDLDLTAEPTVTWSAALPPHTTVLGQTGDTVVLAQDRGLPEDEDWPSRMLIGLDAQTGAKLWRIEDEARTCQLGGAAVTCVLEPGTEAAHVKVHPADGTTGAALAYPGALKALTLEDGGLLVVEGGTTALAELVRLDDEGRALWRSRLSFSGMADHTYGDLAIAGSIASINGGGQLDLASGDELEGAVSWAYDGTERYRQDDSATTVAFPDGHQLLVRPRQLWLDVDDAFGGPISLTIDADGAVIVVGHDGRSTRTLPEGTGLPIVRLNGVLVLAGPDLGSEGTQLVGIDQLTGAELWTRPSEPLFTSGPLTRPSAIASWDTLLLMSEGDVAGVDPLTGETRWSIPVPGARPQGVVLVDGGLLVWFSEEIMRLG